MKEPSSLHQFDVWYLIEMFSVLENNIKALEKWKNLFIQYGYLEESNLQGIQYLDDIQIFLKVFPREHHELKEFDKLLEKNKGETTRNGVAFGAMVAQTIYDKECKRRSTKKAKHLLSPYLLTFREKQT